MSTKNGIITICSGNTQIAIKKADIQSVHSTLTFYPTYCSALYITLEGHDDPLRIQFTCGEAQEVERLLINEWIEDDA